MKNKLDKIKKIKAIKIQKKVKIGIIIGVITIIVIGIVIGTLYQLDKSHQILGGSLEGFFEGEENVKDKQEEEEKQKEKAIEIAVKKFKELGEKVKKEQLEVLKIQRKGELYYYMSAKENSLEIKISDLQITRVNGILVDKESK